MLLGHSRIVFPSTLAVTELCLPTRSLLKKLTGKAIPRLDKRALDAAVVTVSLHHISMVLFTCREMTLNIVENRKCKQKTKSCYGIVVYPIVLIICIVKNNNM